MKGRFALLTLAGLTTSLPALAIVNGHAPEPTDLRFDAIGAFSKAEWMGLASGASANPQEHNWWCNATLIAPDVVITAAHCVAMPWTPGVHSPASPDKQFVVRFRRHLSGSLGDKAAGPQSYHQVRIAELHVADQDVAIGYLEEPVTHIEPLSVLLEGTVGLEPGSSILHAGWGKEGPAFDEGPRNQLLLAGGRVSNQSTTESLLYFFSAWSSMGTGAGVNMFDSGSPVLAENPESGELRILGTVSSTGSGPNLRSVVSTFGDVLESTPFSSPELAVARTFVAAKSFALPGSSVPIEIVNHGGVAAGDDVSLSLALSVEQTPALTVYAAIQAGVPAGGSTTVDVALDGALPFGTYELRAKADADDTLVEGLEGNNAVDSDGYALMVTPELPPYEAFYTGYTQLPGMLHAGLFNLEIHVDGTATLIGFWHHELRYGEGTVSGDTVSIPSLGATLDLSVADEVSGTLATGELEGSAISAWKRTGHLAGAYHALPNPYDLEAVTLLGPSGVAYVYVTDADGDASLAMTNVNADGTTGASTVIVGEAVTGSFGWDEGYDAYRFLADLTWEGQAVSIELVREHGESIVPPHEAGPPVGPSEGGELSSQGEPVEEGSPLEPEAPVVGAPAAGDGGCACSAAPRRVSWHAALGGIALAALLGRRRRARPSAR